MIKCYDSGGAELLSEVVRFDWTFSTRPSRPLPSHVIIWWLVVSVYLTLMRLFYPSAPAAWKAVQLCVRVYACVCVSVCGDECVFTAEIKRRQGLHPAIISSSSFHWSLSHLIRCQSPCGFVFACLCMCVRARTPRRDETVCKSAHNWQISKVSPLISHSLHLTHTSKHTQLYTQKCTHAQNWDGFVYPRRWRPTQRQNRDCFEQI